MNPDKVRSAVVDGLTARAAWNGITMYRYPPGVERTERKQGFELGETTFDSIEMLDMDGTDLQVDYTISGAFWKQKEGAKDADYAEIEAAVMALLLDFWRWLGVVDHGKSLGISGVTVDSMVLPLEEVIMAADGPLFVVRFDLEITEMVTP